jgi:hypothetical protein
VSSNTAVHPLIADAIEEAGFTAAKLPVPSNVDSDGGVRYRIPNSDMEVSTYVDEDGAFVGIDHDDEPAFTSQTMCSGEARDPCGGPARGGLRCGHSPSPRTHDSRSQHHK